MSSQANPNPQSEPTMEEILASIRKIISEDQPPEGTNPMARPAPAKSQPVPEPVTELSLSAAAPAADLDVLDLTDEVHEDDQDLQPAQVVRAQEPSPEAEPAIENDVVFQNVEPISRGEEPTMEDDLISDTARQAMGRTFAHLNGQGPQVALKGGSIEAIFSEAVQQAFRGALKEWIDENSNEVMDQLRPLIRAWMDEHLPPLVEASVTKEIARAADRARKP